MEKFVVVQHDVKSESFKILATVDSFEAGLDIAEIEWLTENDDVTLTWVTTPEGLIESMMPIK